MYKERIFKEIEILKKNLSFKKDAPIGLQIPEGLKQYATEILDSFKEYSPVLFVDPCYGACDIKDTSAINLGCKSLVHFGHIFMKKPKINTYFVPINYVFSKNEKEYIIDQIKKLNLKKINLVTTVNFLEEILKIKKQLIFEKIEVLDSRETMHVRKHMVLGCDASTIIDQKHPIVYVGDGNFHPNNLGFIYKNRDVFVINPILKNSFKLDINEKFLRQRYGLVSKALTKKNFAILVSLKEGQFRLKLAKEIKKVLEKLGKRVYIFVSDYIKEEYVFGMKIDCYVNTACPRISYDDFKNWKKPLLTPQEVYLLEDLTKDFNVDQIKKLE